MEGQEICVAGPVSLEPHGVYFRPTNAAGDSLYGGKIYLPISYADALREGLADGDIFEFTGVLEISKSSGCSLASCFVYYLRK